MAGLIVKKKVSTKMSLASSDLNKVWGWLNAVYLAVLCSNFCVFKLLLALVWRIVDLTILDRAFLLAEGEKRVRCRPCQHTRNDHRSSWGAFGD